MIESEILFEAEPGSCNTQQIANLSSTEVANTAQRPFLFCSVLLHPINSAAFYNGPGVQLDAHPNRQVTAEMCFAPSFCACLLFFATTEHLPDQSLITPFSLCGREPPSRTTLHQGYTSSRLRPSKDTATISIVFNSRRMSYALASDHFAESLV